MPDIFGNPTQEEIEGGGTGENAYTGIPSYLVAADTHSIANGQQSFLNPASWGDRLGNAAKFVASATARAVTSTYNIAPTIGNWFGGEFEKADTETVLRNFDDNLGNYYVENQTGVDIVGDVVASLVPGLGGVKVLNWGQKALKMASAGKAGMNMARAFGTLPDKAVIYGQRAAAEISQSTAQFSWLQGNVLKSLAAGYGQAALEGAAFEIAASSVMRESPLFKEHDVGDVFYNALLGGGLVGGALMGSLTAASTYGIIKGKIKAIDRALNPSRMITELGDKAAASEKILAYTDDLHNTLAKPADVTDEAWTRTLERRSMVLENARRDAVHSLTGKDTQLGNLVADSLVHSNADTVYANLMGLHRIGRVGDDIAIGATAEELNEIKKAVGAAGFKALTAEFNDEVTRRLETLRGEKSPVRYVRLHGDDAGAVFEELPPAAFSLADTTKSADEVLGIVKGKGFRVGQDWNPVALTAQDAEARYIWARDITLAETDVVGALDFPLLERAFELNLPSINIRNVDGTIEQLQLKSGEFLNYLENAKVTAAQRMLDDAVDVAGPSTAEIARKLNVSQNYLEGTVNTSDRASDLFAMQSAAERYTQQQITKGLWKADSGIIKTWLQPQHAKLAYDPAALREVNGFVLDASSYLMARRRVYEQSMDNVVSNHLATINPERVAQFPTIADKDILKADRYGSAPGLFTAANGDYGSLASTMQAIGNVTHALLNDIRTIVSDRFSGHVMNIATRAEDALEIATIRQQILQTPDKYVLDGQRLIKKQQLDYETGLAAGKKNLKQPVFDDDTSPVQIAIKATAVRDFLADWVKHNDTSYLTPQMALRNQQGLPVKDLRGTVYFPGVDPKSMPFHAFVVDPSVTATGHTKMIWARNQNELELLVKKVPNEFKVVYKADTEEYYKALRQYDYNLGINQNYMDTALKRSGVAAPFFPQTDGVKLLQDLVAWRADADSHLARDMIAGKYAAQFKQLEKMSDQFSAAATSKAQGKLRTVAEKSSDPYRSYINTALDWKDAKSSPIWTAANNLAERAFQQLGAGVEDIWKSGKTDDQLRDINAAFQQAGIQTVPYDATLELLANHQAPKPILSNFVRGMNSIMSTFMLRADPLNAVNNGLGANVLLGSETASLVRAIKQGNPEVAGELAQLAYVKIPGVPDSSMLSPTKLVTQAYNNYFRNIMGNVDAGNMRKFYEQNGWITTISQQFKDSLDSLTLAGTENAGELTKRLGRASELARTLGDKAEKYTGNRFAEEMNRYVAADVARQISDLGVKAGVIDAKQQLSYINTFVNRTQGNFLASQRPLLFQGPVGQAVGLFQTYQFNMLQQVFRHISEGSKRDAAILLGLQGSIYGMNGLPAFNAINQYVVGGAAGNVNNRDITQTTFDVAGKELGDWLLYGAASNMLGILDPDLKVNLYSRGDINPRQITVIPTNLADIPIVGFTSKFFSSVYETSQKVASGANPWSAFLQGIEHSGISRPLAGLAQVSQAFGSESGQSYSTSNKGDIVMQNDLFSIANLGRLVGGKPLDEAIARDAVYRAQSYQAARKADLNKLGEAVKTTVISGGTPSPEQLDQFMEEYVKAGGKQQQFSQWMHRIMLNTRQSTVNEMMTNMKNPHAQYLQSIMGGYRLDDGSLQ